MTTAPELEIEDDDLGPIELSPDDEDYPWAMTPDEKLRCFIVEQMGNSEIDGKVLVENLQAVFDWVKTGAVPKGESKKLSRLKTVDPS